MLKELDGRTKPRRGVQIKGVTDHVTRLSRRTRITLREEGRGHSCYLGMTRDCITGLRINRLRSTTHSDPTRYQRHYVSGSYSNTWNNAHRIRRTVAEKEPSPVGHTNYTSG